MKKRLLIGIITAECHEEFQQDILRGIISQSFKTNCDTAVLTTMHNFSLDSPHMNTSKEIFKLILSPRFDGFLYVRNSIHNEDVKNTVDGLLIRSEKPVMLLDCEEHRLFDSTAVDDCSAFEQITDHLINVHGLKKIVCLTGPKNAFVSEERLRGFKVSMKKHGLSCGKSNCLYGDFWEDAANKLADDIISGRTERPEAVVCGNDHSANTLMKALQKGGISIPEDIAVTGYDDTDEGRQNTPSLTSYRRPNFQLGAEAFRRIFRIITGKISRKVHDENGNLMLRQSCGCENPPEKKLSRRERLDKQYETDILYRDMVFNISDNSELSGFADALDNFTYYIYKMKRMYICVTEKYIGSCGGDTQKTLSFDTGDKMKIVLSKSAIKREYPENTLFSSSDILPVYDTERSYPVSYFITPLNYNRSFFGYSAVTFGKLPMTFSIVYKHFVNNVNTALEQVRLRSAVENTADNTQPIAESKDNPQYDKLCALRDRLMKNPEQPWNINSIAEGLYLSKSYLQKMYKQYFGKSIIEEMICFRIEKAKEYLLNTDMTVTEIAKQCGYSSYNYFVRQFKASEGVAPTDFRR